MKTTDLKFTELCEEIDQLKSQLVTEKLLYNELENKYFDLIQSTTRNPDVELRRNIALISFDRKQFIEKIITYQSKDIILYDFINKIAPKNATHEYNQFVFESLVNLLELYKQKLIEEVV